MSYKPFFIKKKMAHNQREQEVDHTHTVPVFGRNCCACAEECSGALPV